LQNLSPLPKVAYSGTITVSVIRRAARNTVAFYEMAANSDGLSGSLAFGSITNGQNRNAPASHFQHRNVELV